MIFLIVIGIFILMRKYNVCVTKILERVIRVLKERKILSRLNRAIKEFRK